MSKNFMAGGSSEIKNKNSAKKYLINYLNQVQIHFNLSDIDVLRVIESVADVKKDTIVKKKWWQIWK